MRCGAGLSRHNHNHSRRCSTQPTNKLGQATLRAPNEWHARCSPARGTRRHCGSTAARPQTRRSGAACGAAEGVQVGFSRKEDKGKGGGRRERQCQRMMMLIVVESMQVRGCRGYQRFVQL